MEEVTFRHQDRRDRGEGARNLVAINVPGISCAFIHEFRILELYAQFKERGEKKEAKHFSTYKVIR